MTIFINNFICGLICYYTGYKNGCKKNKEETKYIHILTGKVGTFVKEFKNYYGDAFMIRLDDGSEYYAPKKEFKQLHSK